MTRAVVVQHSFGDPGSGGPVTALQHVLDSRLADKYDFVRMHQEKPAGGIDVRLVGKWVQQLRALRPDLVHVRGLGNEGFHGALAAKLSGAPRILVSIHGTVRDLTSGQRSARRLVLTRALEPATLRMATHVVTVCHSAARRDFLAPYGPKMLGIVINGVAPLEQAPETRRLMRQELSIHESQTVLVVVGRLSVDKGHLVLAQALKKMPTMIGRLVLLVVGAGPDHTTIENAYRGVPELAVRMLGRRMDVQDILRAADLFVFPTLHENLSNALLEGMGAGLPVVASRVGGNVEILEQGGGVLVPASSPDDLARAIESMLCSPALRNAYGLQAASVVRSRYTIDHMLTDLDRVYVKILDEGVAA